MSISHINTNKRLNDVAMCVIATALISTSLYHLLCVHHLIVMTNCLQISKTNHFCESNQKKKNFVCKINYRRVSVITKPHSLANAQVIQQSLVCVRKTMHRSQFTRM